MSFAALGNKLLSVYGRTKTGEDTWGQPIFAEALKGTVTGRIDPRGGRGRDSTEVVNGPDLNPVISDFTALTVLPSGFELVERDSITDDTGVYEVLGVATLDGRVNAHHLEVSLRRIT